MIINIIKFSNGTQIHRNSEDEILVENEETGCKWIKKDSDSFHDQLLYGLASAVFDIAEKGIKNDNKNIEIDLSTL